MTGKQILDRIFNISFRKGNYLKQLEPLDTQGMVGRKQHMQMICGMLEALDEIEDRYAGNTEKNKADSSL